MMRSYRTDAIVLRRVNFGETDRVLTLFSRDRGRISAVAKGSRRIHSSLGGAAELCAYSAFQLALGTTLEVVTQAELRNAFLGLRSSLDRISRAMYLLEFSAEFLAEHQPQSDLFDLLLSALYALEKKPRLDWVVNGFEMQALEALGYAPQLEVCVSCGRETPDGPPRYSPALGGGICASCTGQRRESLRISPDAILALRRLATFQLPVLGDETVPDAAGAEIRRILRAHIRYRAEREMKSNQFIDKLRAEEAALSDPSS